MSCPSMTQPIHNPNALITADFTQHDYCQFLQLPVECNNVALAVPMDGCNRAQYAYITPMCGDYTVSIGSPVGFTSLPDKNTPFVNPRLLDVREAVNLYFYSENGAKLKVCWYSAKPTSLPIDQVQVAPACVGCVGGVPVLTA